MENLKDFLPVLIASILSIGTVAGLIWDRRRSGVSGLQEEVTKYYKDRKDQQDEKIKEQDLKLLAFAADMAKISGELAELRATIIEKDKHIESLTAVLQGRNPEMIELLKGIKEVLVKNMEITQIALDYQTKMLEKSEVRSEKIDKASETKEGDPMLVPEK